MRLVSLGLAAALAVGVALAGCSIGPRVLRTNRAGYNVAAQRSAGEQLLLNIVRLKYREPLLFLQIGSISSHFNYSANASVSGSFPEGTADTHGASAGAGISEQPTITYTPLEGQAFANRILTETDMGTFTLLVRGGWSIDTLMRLMVQRIGPLQNYPSASEPGGGKASYERFLELARLWRERQRAGELRFLRLPGAPAVVAENVPPEEVSVSTAVSVDSAGYMLRSEEDGAFRVEKPGAPSLAVQVGYRDAAQADRADRLLGIRPERRSGDGGEVVEIVRLVAAHEYYARDPGQRAANEVPIQLRSYSDVLYYVAQGVEVPAGHEKLGLTKVYRDEAGRAVNRRQFTRDLLDVRSSALPPTGALVAVPYRGRWFYIADSDSDSKDTFALLSIVFALQSEERGQTPLLTLPVSD
jgi:hypothetical protein